MDTSNHGKLRLKLLLTARRDGSHRRWIWYVARPGSTQYQIGYGGPSGTPIKRLVERYGPGDETTARNLLHTIFTLTDSCIEQGGLYPAEECVGEIFNRCYAYFHPNQ